jgi:hypothetical protein
VDHVRPQAAEGGYEPGDRPRPQTGALAEAYDLSAQLLYTLGQGARPLDADD